MTQTITTSHLLRVGDILRVRDRLLHVWHEDGRTYSLRREPLNRWGNKMARWRARRAA